MTVKCNHYLAMGEITVRCYLHRQHGDFIYCIFVYLRPKGHKYKNACNRFFLSLLNMFADVKLNNLMDGIVPACCCVATESAR